ncbi:hypothetical protein CCP3SC15_1110012 [Gammaproteobacteria bacterium]
MTQQDLFTQSHRMHQNSLAAYSTEQQAISKRARDILRHFAGLGEAVTDREMMRIMGFTDPNAVRPRITELTDAGCLMELGKVKDTVTGKLVRTSCITGKGRAENGTARKS